MYPLIRSKFENDYIVDFEVPLLSSRKRIDVLCLSKDHKKNNPELIAIEAKIKDRKQVIRQAYQRLFVADKVYIALHEKHISEKFLNSEIFEELPIGLISVNGKAYIEKNAKKSHLLIENRKKRTMEIMLEKSNYKSKKECD